jgi:hypothetical protein
MVENERRVARRYELAVPVKVEGTEAPAPVSLPGHTRDISTSGLYFNMEFPPRAGSLVSLRLTLPPTVTGGEEVLVELSARIVRVEPSRNAAGGPLGVAARIEKYDIVKASSKKRPN